jgi:hypothetical protein
MGRYLNRADVGRDDQRVAGGRGDRAGASAGARYGDQARDQAGRLVAQKA